MKFFVDFLAQKRHDHNFTTSAWTKLLAVLEERDLKVGGKIAKLVVWSDGGLKTKENLYSFNTIATKFNVTVSVNFFGAYHGHSEVRRRKKKVRKEKKNDH